MYSFDASSMIHAWDNYPPENPLFGALWCWVAEKPQAKKLKFVGILINKDVSHENHRERCKKSSLGRVVGGKPCGFWVFYWIPACAGMTGRGVGMTGRGAGMTGRGAREYGGRGNVTHVGFLHSLKAGFLLPPTRGQASRE